MKITSNDLKSALAMMSMLRYFPSDEMAHRAILIFLESLCGTQERLSWMVHQLVNKVGEWPGPAQVRGMLCSRFKPADGIEAECSIPGFTPADGERRTEAGQLQFPVDGARGTRCLPKAEAMNLIEGLKDPAFERDFIEKQIARLRVKARESVGKPGMVRNCLNQIAEHEKALERLQVTA